MPIIILTLRFFLRNLVNILFRNYIAILWSVGRPQPDPQQHPYLKRNYLSFKIVNLLLFSPCMICPATLEKDFRNLFKSNGNQVVYTIFQLIWIQTDTVRLDLNRSEDGKYNSI